MAFPPSKAMACALDEARAAAARDEVPVGAVVTDAAGQVLAQAGNRTRELNDPTAHAEMLAIRAACAAQDGDGSFGGGCGQSRTDLFGDAKLASGHTANDHDAKSNHPKAHEKPIRGDRPGLGRPEIGSRQKETQGILLIRTNSGDLCGFLPNLFSKIELICGINLFRRSLQRQVLI